jgi:succinate-acetate transporter protein
MALIDDRPVSSGPSSWPTGPFYAPVASGLPITIFTFGFALAVLSLSNAQVFTPKAAGLWVPVAFACGLGNLIGGLWSFRANDVYGATFGIAYGLFLVATGLIVGSFGPGIVAAAGAAGFGGAFGSWLFLWAVFSLVFAYGAYYINAPAFIVFCGLVVIFVLLALANVGPANLAVALTQAAGWLGLLTAAVAWYLAAALILNPTIGRDVLPIPLMRPPRA